jgi:hypothetical protein
MLSLPYPLLALAALCALGACVTTAAPPVSAALFGSDVSDYANNGECDDPRFVGSGMDSVLDRDDEQRDATDCRKLFEAGQLRLEVALRPANSIAMCQNLNFGNNSSQWARDDECDDPRFTGPGVDSILTSDDLKADAADCKAACAAGTIWLK